VLHNVTKAQPSCITQNSVQQKVFLMLCTGDKLQQEHLHTADNWHHRITPVSCHAEVVNIQRSCLHTRLLRHISSESGRT